MGNPRFFQATSILVFGLVLSVTSKLYSQTTPVLAGEFERLASTTSLPGWLEGPAYDGVGGIWFTDLTIPIVDAVSPPLLFRYDIATGALEEKLRETGGANGLAFDSQGLLIAAHGEDRNLTRRPIEALDDVTVLSDGFEGNTFSGPNDIVVDSQGGIYFTDPSVDVGRNSVFYLSPSNELQRVSDGVWFNNGLVLSPDGDTLYVAATLGQSILAFDVHVDGTLSNQRPFVESLRADGRTFTPDGMTIDRFGNVYAADLAASGGPATVGNFDPTDRGARIWAFNPTGEEVLRFDTPDNAAANLLFGPDDFLYLTATDALYRVPISFVPEPNCGAFMSLVVFLATLGRHRRKRHVISSVSNHKRKRLFE